MNRKLFLNISKIIRSSNIATYPLLVGTLEDNYLPTNFEKREKIVTIFGATGFFGEYLVHELAKRGYQLILPYRGDVHDFKHIRMIGGVGQNCFMPYSIDDNNSIELAIKHSDAVINLIGRNYQNNYVSFNELHVDIAAKIARISYNKGVKYYIHMSSLNVSDNPKPHLMDSGSQFLKSKWHGEREVAREFPGAVIIRPSNLWGKNDDFIFYFTNRTRKLFGKKVNIPLWKLGQETVKQPVYAGDVSQAIALILFEEKYRGCTFELVGHQRFQLDHLVTWFYLNMKYLIEDIKISEFNDWFLFKAKYKYRISASVPHFTIDSLETECLTDQLTGCKTLDDLEIIPCKMEDRIHWIVKPYGCHGYKWDDLGGFPPPPCPPSTFA